MTNRGNRRFKPLLLAACAALAIVPAVASAQQAPAPITYDIPAQDLGTALTELARQSNREIYFSADLTRGKRAPRLRGSIPVERALERLLDGSGLTYKLSPSGAITIESAVGNGSAAGETASSSGEEVAQNERGVAEILVVGKKTQNVDIRRSENDPQPYVVFGSKDIEASSAANIEDFLKQRLTSDTTFALGSQALPSIGGSTNAINLRGLGADKTLILVNGRRRANVSINGSFAQPSISGIPLSAIERIEAISSSASAIYGGSAIGGVVNIILKKNYSGGEFVGSWTKPLDSHADDKQIYGSIGTSFFGGTTHIMLGGNYQKSVPLLLGDRAGVIQGYLSTILASQPSLLISLNAPYPGATPNISSNSGPSTNRTPLTLRNGTPLNSTMTSIPVGAAAGDNLSAALVAAAGSYNLNMGRSAGIRGVLGQLAAAQESSSANFSIRQEFGAVELFAELSHENFKTTGQSDLFGSTFMVPASAPTNPFQQAVRLRLPVAELFETKSSSRTDTVSLGAVAPLFAHWRGGIDYTRSWNDLHFDRPLRDSAAFNAALNNGTIDPFVDTIAHPLNLDPYVGKSVYRAKGHLDDLNSHFSGTLGRLPGGKPQITIGLQYRREAAARDTTVQTFPITTSSSSIAVDYDHSQSVWSGYAEALLPVVGPDNNIPLIRSIDVQMAFRIENYQVRLASPTSAFAVGTAAAVPDPKFTKTKYTAASPTVALRYSPIAGLVLRGSYAKAFLPPNPSQLVINAISSCPNTPCVTIFDPVLNQSYQVSQLVGGNPNLKPQRSKAWLFGVIVEPIRNIRLSADYSNIVQPNFITSLSASAIAANPNLANRVKRDPTSGAIVLIDATALNALKYKTDAIDIAASVNSGETSVGSFSAEARATHVFHNKRQLAVGAPLLEYAGFPADGGPVKGKIAATFDWHYRSWLVSWTSTFYSSYKQAFSPGSPSAVASGVNQPLLTAQGGDKIGSQIYNNIFIRYRLKRPGQSLLNGLAFEISVKNVFNKKPPFDANSLVTPYFYSPLGDINMRTIQLNVRKTF